MSPVVEELTSQDQMVRYASAKGSSEDQATYALSLHSQMTPTQLQPPLVERPKIQRHKSQFPQRDSFRATVKSRKEASSATATTVNEEIVKFDSILEVAETAYDNLPLRSWERADSAS